MTDPTTASREDLLTAALWFMKRRPRNLAEAIRWRHWFWWKGSSAWGGDLFESGQTTGLKTNMRLQDYLAMCPQEVKVKRNPLAL